MANLSTYGANAFLDGTALPATLWVQLHLGNPTAAGTANPASSTSRRSFTTAAAVAGVVSNDALMEWLAWPATEDFTHITIWDASTAGNCWFIDAINGGIAAGISGQAVEIAINQLTITAPIWS